MIKTLIFTLSLIFTHLLTTGCTSLQSFPNAARAGDTVALAIGSPDGATRNNTTAVFVSKSHPDYPAVPAEDEHPLTIRSLFKLYGDKASQLYARGDVTKQIIDTSGHEAWVTVAAIDLPATLPPGFGEVRFTSSADYPTVNSHIDDVPIDLEILPAAAGTGMAHPFPIELGTGSTGFGDLTTLEPQNHAVVYPTFSGTSTYPNYGAIELKIDMPTTAPVGDRSLRVLVDDMSMQSDSKRSVTSRLSNGEDLTVIILSPVGKLKYYEARINIVLPGTAQFDGQPTIASVNYYDIDGAPTAGPLIADYVIEERYQP